MSLFGEKCHRCGSRTRKKDGDTPVCPPCAETMRLMSEADVEERRTCPIDGTTMAKEVRYMVVMDRCPECRGVWLDGGELQLIGEHAEEAALRALAGAFSFPPA